MRMPSRLYSCVRTSVFPAPIESAVASKRKIRLEFRNFKKIKKQILKFEWVPIAIGTTMSFLSDYNIPMPRTGTRVF